MPRRRRRDDELEQIHEALTSGGTAAVFSAVVGLGGVGKSRLALEHAFRSASKYDVRWWVRASESASMHEDLVRLGQRLGVLGEVVDMERAVDEVLDWLSKHQRWLLVLDNAEGPDELRKALRGRLTRLGSGHVLITSRAQAWRGLAKPIEITTLAPEAARAVLLERSGRHDDGFADAVAERLRASLSDAIVWGEFRVVTSASIGLVLSASFYTHADQILRDADTAMYRAKAAGGGRIAVFHETSRARAAGRQ